MCPPRRSILESIGSGVTTLRELSWETAGFEQQIYNTFTTFGSRVSHFVGPASSPVKEFAKERPIAAFLIGCFIATCALPILAFLSFALVTLSIGLVGFLCIEGTILSFALLILGSCLLTISFIGLSIGAGVLVVYLAFSKSRQFIETILAKLFPPTTATGNEKNGAVANTKFHSDDELSCTESDSHAEPSPRPN